jgi:cytochrome c oxidase subunit 1
MAVDPQHLERVYPSAPDANEVDFYHFKGRWGTGLASWIFSTDHKKIGLMYLTLMLSWFTIGMSLGFLMRLELFTPGRTIVDAQTYNTFFTVHGVIMIFLFVIPGLSASMGNFVLPIMIGAKDVQFPRLNLLSWWLYAIGGMLAITALFTGAGPPDTGWTFYAPYSIRTGTNVTLAAFAVFVLGFSSILTGLNFVTTIHRMRAPGMGFMRMPLFVWAVYATGWLQVVATPVIGITMVLIMVERAFGIGVFDPVKGGDPILYQHLFWIYSHPAVYIMILPGLGAISEVITVHARRTIFGYSFIAMSSIAIALFGSIVWAHHMFVSGNSLVANFVFSLLTMIVAIPSAVKVFNWVATLYKARSSSKHRCSTRWRSSSSSWSADSRA